MDRALQFVDRALVDRALWQQRFDVDPVVDAGDAFGALGRQAHQGFRLDVRGLLEAFGDGADAFEHGRLVDVTGLRGDCDHQHVVRAEYLFCEVGADHVRMLLRQHLVGVDDDLQVPHLRHHEDRDQDRQHDHQQPPFNDPCYQFT
jgi:hypothetical protein